MRHVSSRDNFFIFDAANMWQFANILRQNFFSLINYACIQGILLLAVA